MLHLYNGQGCNPPRKILSPKNILNAEETEINVSINVSINVQLMLQGKKPYGETLIMTQINVSSTKYSFSYFPLRGAT